MIDKQTYLQIIGSLMKHPQLLSETDKYNLSIDDFGQRFFKYIYRAIETLYSSNDDINIVIKPIDIENCLAENATAATIFKENGGIEWLQDAEYMANVDMFGYYYNKLKKINLLNNLNNIGIDTSSYYVENKIGTEALEINSKFEDLTIDNILDDVKKKLLKVENKFITNDATEVSTAFEGIENIIAAGESKEDVGLAIQGSYLNEIVAGARKGALYIRSAGSGVGKTRQAVGDACMLAFPIRFNTGTWQWEKTGASKKVLFIATEQDKPEIQKMILAYLTGLNDTKFRYGTFNDSELTVLHQALEVMKIYQDNFYIVRMPNPTIGLMKNIIRENVLIHEVEYVFYDYIFIGPAVLNEFRGFNLRNDEILLMMATALKDLAVELKIFVMTSTQVSAAADDGSKIRNEGSIAGARAIINKADVGLISARPTNEDLDYFEGALKKSSYIMKPNMYTDVYKVRSGQYTQVRIWSYVDLGTLRKEDYFVTNERREMQDIQSNFIEMVGYNIDEVNEILEKLGTIK